MTNLNERDLCIFVTSAIPDVFINVIGYCAEHYSLGQVLLVSIIKDKGQKSSEEAKIARIRDSIVHQLNLLQAGKYQHKNQETEIEISPHDKIRYTKIARAPISTKVLIYNELEKDIEHLLQKKEPPYLFDISAILKAYLIEVFALLLSRGMREVYAFELKLKERTFNERELIHNLSIDTGDYEYVNIAQSQYISGLTFERIEHLHRREKSQKALEILMEDTATRFANRTMLAYAMLVFSMWILVARAIILADWNKLEPWTFVLCGLPVFPYIGSILSQMVFQKIISPRPALIFEWLRTWRKNRILRKIDLE